MRAMRPAEGSRLRWLWLALGLVLGGGAAAAISWMEGGPPASVLSRSTPEGVQLASLPGLAAEAAALRARAAGEQARLDAFTRAAAAAQAGLEELRRETGALEQRRATLMRCGAQSAAVQEDVPAIIHHRARSRIAREAAERIAEELRKAGIEGSEIRPEFAVPGERVLRHAATEEDGALAAMLAGRFRRRWQHPWRVEPTPDDTPAARVEVWLPH